MFFLFHNTTLHFRSAVLLNKITFIGESLSDEEKDKEEDEKEDELTPGMKLHELFDMTEDVAESVKLKRAEFNLVRRQTEDSL